MTVLENQGETPNGPFNPGPAAAPIAPFLRWAGGKRWLVPKILELTRGRSFNQYFEPFLGGGAVFLGLALDCPSTLSDSNEDLIEVYETVRDNSSGVANLLAAYENTSQLYYETRSNRPNNATERAARFIFLNHTSFNGIYRVNLRGEYNVPFGRRASINLPTADHLAAAASSLTRSTITSGDFAQSLAAVGQGDLVFVDPPYTVAHNENGFIKYNRRLFSFDDQKRLAAELEAIVERGADFIMTNAAHASIREVFGHLGTVSTVSRKSAVGGSRAARGRADELLVTTLRSDS